MKKSLMWAMIIKGMGLLFMVFQFVSSIFEMNMFQAMVDEAVEERLGSTDDDIDEEA